MIPFETLLELWEIAFADWSIFPVYRAQPATDSSIALIEKSLGIALPASLVELSRGCPSYGCWLAAIGDDCDHGLGILALNRAFHNPDDDGPALPAHLILLNHGHDRDCDCWDTSSGKSGDEYPIVYCALEQGPTATKALAPTFYEYLEQLCRYYAPRSPNKKRRRRARELLALDVDASSSPI
jgi:hypothetical protein